MKQYQIKRNNWNLWQFSKLEIQFDQFRTKQCSFFCLFMVSISLFIVDKVPVGCKKLRSKRYFSDGDCYSAKPIIEEVCVGSCVPVKEFDFPWWPDFVNYWSDNKQKEHRCVNDKVRRKKIQLICRDGSLRTYTVKVVKSCKCKIVNKKRKNRRGRRRNRKNKRHINNKNRNRNRNRNRRNKGRFEFKNMNTWSKPVIARNTKLKMPKCQCDISTNRTHLCACAYCDGVTVFQQSSQPSPNIPEEGFVLRMRRALQVTLRLWSKLYKSMYLLTMTMYYTWQLYYSFNVFSPNRSFVSDISFVHLVQPTVIIYFLSILSCPFQHSMCPMYQ